MARAQPHAGARGARRGWQDEGLIEMAPQRYTRVAPLEAATPRTRLPGPRVDARAGDRARRAAARPAGPRRAATRHNDAFIGALRGGDAGPRLRRRRALPPGLRRPLREPRGRRRARRSSRRACTASSRCADRAVPGRRSVAQHEAIVLRASAGAGAAGGVGRPRELAHARPRGRARAGGLGGELRRAPPNPPCEGTRWSSTRRSDRGRATGADHPPAAARRGRDPAGHLTASSRTVGCTACTPRCT